MKKLNKIQKHALECALKPSWWRLAFFRIGWGQSAPRDIGEWHAFYLPNADLEGFSDIKQKNINTKRLSGGSPLDIKPDSEYSDVPPTDCE